MRITEEVNKEYVKPTDNSIYKNIPGRFLRRMKKNANGMYQDENLTLSDGRIIPVVFPYRENSANKRNFREMTLQEIEEWRKAIEPNAKMPYEVLERKLKELENSQKNTANKVNPSVK